MEVIIVNNGSTDNSAEVISSKKNIIKNLKIIEIKKNVGFGNGVKQGIKNATSNIICYTHADLQFDLENVHKAFIIYKSSNFEKNFIKGSRKKRSVIEDTFTFFMSMIIAPNVIYNLLPFIVFLSAMWLFLKLVKTDEINAMKTSGLSNISIIFIPCFVGFFLGVFSVVAVNPITSAPFVYKYYLDFDKKDSVISVGGGKISGRCF